MSSIIAYLSSMFSYLIIALPLFLVFRVFWVKVNNRNWNFLHEAGIVLFFSFLTGLFALTFDQDSSDRQTAVNIVPFKVFSDTFHAISKSGLWDPFTINFLGNVLIFSPIGFFLPLLWQPFRFWKTVLAGFLVSLFIETVQLFLNRSSDVDDLWLNTVGAVAGFGIYKLVSKSSIERFKLFRA